MKSSRNIAKVYSKVSLKNSGSDFAYWQAQSYQERLGALEQIRKEYNLWKYGAEPRLQRVHRIVKRQ
jgi:hypothetical protein